VWDIEATDQFVEWWDSLTFEEQQSVSGPVGLLEQHGPSLARPLVDSAILLIGGDKRDRWKAFYEEMIPLADDLFDEHLNELETEGGA